MFPYHRARLAILDSINGLSYARVVGVGATAKRFDLSALRVCQRLSGRGVKQRIALQHGFNHDTNINGTAPIVDT